MNKLIVTSLLIGTSMAHATDEVSHNIVDDAWATSQGVHFSGRTTGDNHRPADANKNKINSTYRSARLVLASGKATEVSWQVGTLNFSAQSDAKGYWQLSLPQALSAEALAPGWHNITTTPPASSNAGLLVHDPRNVRGIISDIDDTILVSQVNYKRKLLRNSLAITPENRQAVAGMAQAYQHIANQNPNPQATPIFYVSATPRQLTDSVRRFLKHNQFPRGLLQLKEVRAKGGDPWSDQKSYKIRRITAIFEAFPNTQFLLIGDDGEYDPESYQELQAKFPKQIEAVWIRRVNPNKTRPRFEGQGDVADFLVKN
jgi:phosphatidate phosphatase APP1